MKRFGTPPPPFLGEPLLSTNPLFLSNFLMNPLFVQVSKTRQGGGGETVYICILLMFSFLTFYLILIFHFIFLNEFLFGRRVLSLVEHRWWSDFAKTFSSFWLLTVFAEKLYPGFPTGFQVSKYSSTFYIYFNQPVFNILHKFSLS